MAKDQYVTPRQTNIIGIFILCLTFFVMGSITGGCFMSGYYKVKVSESKRQLLSSNNDPSPVTVDFMGLEVCVFYDGAIVDIEQRDLLAKQ